VSDHATKVPSDGAEPAATTTQVRATTGECTEAGKVSAESSDMSNRLLTQVIDELDPGKLREAIKALLAWKSERTGKSRRVPVVNIKPMLMVIADKTNDDAPQKGMWYSQPHIARMTGYSVSQIQQCQYIAQALGVLKVVPRSNKTTGKQTTSMYIIIPQALERFRFPPI